MSDPARRPEPANSLSSGSLFTPESASCDDNLQSLWGGVFYHPTFVNAACGILKLSGRSEQIIIDGMARGISNSISRTRVGVRVATLPLLFQYYGPILFASESSGAFDEHCNKICSDFDYLHLSLPPNVNPTESVAKRWRIMPLKTVALSGKDLSAWGSDFRDDVKNKIRKAKREKVVITKSMTLPQSLWQISFERKSVSTPISPESLGAWCDALVASSLLTIYIAEINGQPVAFRGQLKFGNYAYDWIAGSDPQFHSAGINQLLMAEIGDELSKMNLTSWDLIGGEIAAIADFKKSFGAKEVMHLHLIRAFTIKGKVYSVLKNLKYGNS
jgi:hypothetical protein